MRTPKCAICRKRFETPVSERARLPEHQRRGQLACKVCSAALAGSGGAVMLVQRRKVEEPES